MPALLTRLSIRTQLMVLVLAIMLPVVALLATMLVNQLQDTREAARQTVRMLASNTAADLSGDLTSTQTVLARLAARPLARKLDPAFCGVSLAEYVDLHPEFVTLGFRDLQANLVCTSLPNPPPAATLVNAAWFRNGIDAGKFVASDAMIGPATGRWVSIRTQPVRDDNGAVRGLLALPVDLYKAGDQLLANVPKGAIVAVLDRSGAVMMRSANAAAFVGKRGDPRAEEATRGMREGFTSNTSLDGVTRLWAFVTVPGVEWRVVAGLPEAEIFAPYYARLRRSLALAAGILLLASLLAWRIAAAIVRPVSGLAHAVARLATGDDGARARAEGPREIVAMAQQFNQMLDARDRNLSALRLSDLAFKAVTQGVVITGANRRMLSVNDAFVAMTGHDRSALLGNSFALLQGPDTDPATVQAMRAACEQGVPFAGQILNYRANGESFWNELTISPVHDGQSVVTHFIGVMRDISERQRAVRALRESEENLSITLQSIGDAVIATDAAGRVTRMNPVAERLSGWPLADARGRPLSEVFCIVHAQTREPAINPVDLVMQHGKVVGLANHTALMARGGQEYQIADSAAPILDHSGETVGVVLVFSDVTEQYRVAQALRDSEANLAQAQATAHLGSWYAEVATGAGFWSAELARLHHQSPDFRQPSLAEFLQVVHPDDRPLIRTIWQQVKGSSGTVEFTYRTNPACGPERVLAHTVGAERNDAGRIVRLQGTSLDVTEREAALEALRRNEENLSITLQSIGDAVIATDAVGHVTRMNPVAERLTGWPLADALGQPLTEVFRIIHAESRVAVRNPVDLVMEHGKVVGLANHTALLARDGAEYQIADSAAPIHDPAGAIVGVVLVFSDVTEQYRVAQALRQSEERFRSSFDASGVGMAINSLDGRWVQVNQALCDIVGYTVQEMMALTFQEITHPDDLAEDLGNMRLLLDGSIRSFQMEKRYLHRAGHTVWISLSVALVRDAHGAPLHTVAHMQDITRRKTLEEELRDSEQRYRRIVQTAEEGIWSIDAQARTTYVNPKMAALLGYTEADMLGRPLTDFMDDEGRAIAQANLERRRQGITEQHDFKFQRQDGSALWTLVATNPVLDAQGAYVGALAMVTDISARRQAEEALRKSLREKEALLREVHHRVKNNLQVVHSLLRLESGRALNQAAKSVLNDMQTRVKSMALLHESLYRSHSFAAVELGAYLRQVGTQVMRAAATLPGAVRLDFDLAPAQVTLDQAAPCGLLVNELVSNALKHAFPDGQGGEIRLALRPTQDGVRLCLRVSDNGIGLPADFDLRRSQSLGLQLVSDLCQQLGAELEIGPLPNAVFTLQFKPDRPGEPDTSP